MSSRVRTWLVYSAVALFVAGVAGLALHAYRVSSLDWRPLSVSMSSESGTSVAASFTAPRTALYEIAIEVDRIVSEEALYEMITVTRSPSTLDLTWAVRQQDRVVASGGAIDYLFVDPGPVSALGAASRILMRIPFEQNDTYFASFGLLGSTTASRGLGAFQAEEGVTYEIRARSPSGFEALAAGRPRLNVRLNRRLWYERYARTRPAAYASLAAIGASLLLLVAWTVTPSGARSPD